MLQCSQSDMHKLMSAVQNDDNSKHTKHLIRTITLMCCLEIQEQ